MRANVNQKSKSFPGRSERLGRKNMFDLSHDHKLTFTMGKLVPYLTLETYPGDRFFIRGEFMHKFAPLYLPIMHRINMEAAIYYIPWRIMWGKRDATDDYFTEWIYNFDATQASLPTYPVIPYNFNTLGYRYEVPMYMGFPSYLESSGAVATWQINAGPMNAYYLIWDQFYRNDQIQDVVIGDYLLAGPNVPPYDSTPQVLTCKYRNWNRDLFTSATNLPQLGSEVHIPLVDTDFISPAGFAYGGPFRWLDRDVDTAGSGALSATVVGTEAGATNAAATGAVYLDIQETAGSIAQLRMALMYQEFLERANRAGDRYSDNSIHFWGVDPEHGTIQVPQFIGANYGKVIVSEVLSTTETATLKVGSYAGQAIALESTQIHEYSCEEHGFVIGIISIYPESSYMQGIEKMWTRQQPLDFAWEQFALIGDEAILNQEVNADLKNIPTDADYNTDIFGYQRRYYNDMYKNDIYSGEMRTTMISFHLGRVLPHPDPTTTVLDTTFLECRPDITRCFQVTEGEDEIYSWILNDVKVLRRLPKSGIPAV